MRAKLLQLCLILCNSMDCKTARLFCSWDSPGKNTGVGCHALLQGIFPTQGSKPGCPHCRRILYRLSHQGSPWILEWVPIPSPGDLPYPGIKLGFPELQANSLPAELPGKLKAVTASTKMLVLYLAFQAPLLHVTRWGVPVTLSSCPLVCRCFEHMPLSVPFCAQCRRGRPVVPLGFLGHLCPQCDFFRESGCHGYHHGYYHGPSHSDRSVFWIWSISTEKKWKGDKWPSFGGNPIGIFG